MNSATLAPAQLHIKVVDCGSPQYQQTLDLRNEILRRPFGLQFTPEDRRNDEPDFHLACFHEDRLVGCLILKALSSAELKMRQFAVAGVYQRRGVGRALVAFAERFAADHGFHVIELNARETAVPFYEKLGYLTIGDRFLELGIPHFKMHKTLGASDPYS